MLMWLSAQLVSFDAGFAVFQYLTLRGILATLQLALGTKSLYTNATDQYLDSVAAEIRAFKCPVSGHTNREPMPSRRQRGQIVQAQRFQGGQVVKKPGLNSAQGSACTNIPVEVKRLEMRQTRKPLDPKV